MRLLQNRDRYHSAPVPIFTVDQMASSIATENDESAKLIHLVLWRYLPTQQVRTVTQSTDKKVVLISCCSDEFFYSVAIDGYIHC